MTDYKLVPAERQARALFEEMALIADDEKCIQILAKALSVAPAVQGEPVGEVRFDLGAPSVIYAELYSETLPSLAPGTKLYTTPQPAEQQPAPDVAGLVEALTELCDEIDKHEIHSAISKTNISWFKRKARAALAQGQGET